MIKKNGVHIAFLALAGVLIATCLTALGTFGAFNSLGLFQNFQWSHVLVWGGLRGLLSMVLILGFPADFVGRSVLVNLVFGVVSVSLFLQGLTMGPLMKRLGLTHEHIETNRENEMARGRSLSYRQVINETKKLLDRGVPNDSSYRHVLKYYNDARDKAQGDILKYGTAQASPDRLIETVKFLALIEREFLSHTLSKETISAVTCAELMNSISIRFDELGSASEESEEAMVEVFERLYGNLAESK